MARDAGNAPGRPNLVAASQEGLGGEAADASARIGEGEEVMRIRDDRVALRGEEDRLAGYAIGLCAWEAELGVAAGRGGRGEVGPRWV
ncbi:hypothetical protein FRC12_013062 [Ceratobasidium sp. 428]|nr:hypothetical protein FRC12_013062 [Ceratobasidium sp. 428]